MPNMLDIKDSRYSQDQQKNSGPPDRGFFCMPDRGSKLPFGRSVAEATDKRQRMSGKSCSQNQMKDHATKGVSSV